MLERSVGLDPTFAPAWSALGKRYYYEEEYGIGATGTMSRTIPALRRALRALAWGVWASGFALTIFTISGSVSGMVISTAVLMTLLCPWVAAFGWKLTREKTELARALPLCA